MKTRCRVPPLRDSFQLVSNIVAARNPKPILTNVKLSASQERLELLATDLEVGIRCAVEGVEIAEEGVALVNAARLSDILRECDDEHINLETTGFVTKVTYTNADYSLQGADPADFPLITEYDPEGSIELNGADLQKMIRYTSFAASRDTTSFALNGVFFVLRPNEIRLIGADRHRLAFMRKKASNPEGTKGERIVPTKAMEQLERMMSKADETVGVKVLEKQIVFRVKRGTVAAHLVEGKYPDYEAVIPKDCDSKVDLETQVLLHSVRKAAPVAPEESRTINVRLAPNQLTVSSSDSEIGSAEIDVGIEYDGKDVGASFNPGYLTDLLRVTEEERVRLELKDANSPGLIRIGKDYVYVIMPMQTEE